MRTIIKFVPLAFANVQFAYHSAAGSLLPISVRDYPRNCANLFPFVTFVDAVESNDTSNDTYKSSCITYKPLSMRVNIIETMNFCLIVTA